MIGEEAIEIAKIKKDIEYLKKGQDRSNEKSDMIFKKIDDYNKALDLKASKEEVTTLAKTQATQAKTLHRWGGGIAVGFTIITIIVQVILKT